ncbi:MAG: 4Fe-4S dicluster domain-containing protein [Candidatus Thermoplasmatota archaeon]|nr:4Fe-4S dicluster domain-containing protein [Candidatus Thermoplasmatota archaeon]MBU1940802.1 4Fe-4S dicluster domain-containing protein [Candidatus Thermoplasmatota archaeon]
MEKYTLPKADLPKFIKEMIGKNRVYAPVENDNVTLFKEINTPSNINLDFINSKIPPKSLLFQQTETLFKFIPGTKGKIDPPDLDDKKTVIFGIRPCDAKSFAILDHAFTGDFNDPYFINHRKNTTLVGMSCTKPGINCFCTSFNDSPAQSKYLDILLTDIGDKYYVEVTNEKGKQLAKDLKKHMQPAKESDTEKKKEIEKKAIKQITRNQKTEGITEKLDKIFENPFWKEVANKCVSCGTCTYLCPTCHCFDIQDESTLTKGARVRVWDTCMNPEYTLHASKFNPRPARTNRVRNRIYHKYNYYPKNFDIIACVGCGRCIDLCPVNIDIIDVVTKAGEVKL